MRWDCPTVAEQGTSASHMAAAKFLDFIARMPDMEGEDADATGAYTQSVLKGQETWVRLPKYWWSAELHGKYTNPVIRFRISLYGHPKAGLYWEQHCHQALTTYGFVKLKGWECLNKHPQKGLFLSVYVDDFKMAGRAGTVAPMWT